jgi:hypothetical protein
MGDDVFPLPWSRMSFVVFLHPVGFQHDTITRFDEVTWKFQSGKRIPDLLMKA